MSESRIWTDNPKGPSSSIIPQRSGLTLGDTAHPWKSITVEDLVVTDDLTTTDTMTAARFNLSDGSDKNYSLSVYAAGTAYALTATSAALDFGTTDPTLVLNKGGTYLLLASVNLQFNGATFAASRTVTLKLRRTNNTAADVANSSAVLGTGITVTVTGNFATVNLPPVVYSTSGAAVITDSISIFGDVSVVPSAGSLDATQASITAVRLYA